MHTRDKKIFFSGTLIILSALLLFSSPAKSQRIDYLVGPEVRSDYLGSFKLFSYDATRLFVFRERNDGSKKSYHLQSYSRDSLKLLTSTIVPFPKRGKAILQIENLIVHDDYYMVFYSWFDAENKMEKLEMISFNEIGEQIWGSKVIDFSEEKKGTVVGNFSILNRPSRDEFISFAGKYVNKELNFNIDHFDYNGNKLRTTNFMNVALRHVVFSKVMGTGSILFITNDPYDSYNPDWRIKVLTPESETPVRIKLEKPYREKFYLSDKFFSFIDLNGDINFITPTSKGVNTGSSNGLYLVKLDAGSYQLLNEEFIPFNPGKNKATTDEEDFTLSSCIIANVSSLPDGRMNVILESRLSVWLQGGASNPDVMYKLGNILSVEIDSTFSVTGVCRIEKRQELRNDNSRFAGFNLLQSGSNSFFIFNDLPQNLSAEKSDKPMKLSDKLIDGSVITVVKSEGNHITGKKVLVERDSTSIRQAILINTSMSTASDELYTLFEVDKEVFLARIALKEE